MEQFSLQPIDDFLPDLPMNDHLESPICYLQKNNKLIIQHFLDDIAKSGNLVSEQQKFRQYIISIYKKEQLPQNTIRAIQGTGFDNIREIKTRHLRLYIIVSKNIIIVLGGKKTEQKQDISRLKSLLNDLSSDPKLSSILNKTQK